MKAIIIDDEATARAIVNALCQKENRIKVIQEFDNAIDAIKFLNQNTVDVVFIDIHMPGFSGIDFIQTLKDSPLIVFTTSSTDFAIESFAYPSVVDYLVKPIKPERFKITIQKIDKMMASFTQDIIEDSESKNVPAKDSADTIYINIDRRLIKLNVANILVVEANGDYINITTVKETFKVHTTLKKIKDKLPDEMFIQIHRSFVINFSKIIDIEDNSVLIEKKVIPISRSKRPALMKRLNLV